MRLLEATSFMRPLPLDDVICKGGAPPGVGMKPPPPYVGEEVRLAEIRIILDCHDRKPKPKTLAPSMMAATIPTIENACCKRGTANL